ncbi:hypothetical protein [uncultured Psychrobacter sp.]|uniref:hypothetical protein n=1 Tax=uncultured Psychrobacter sp. TaxID=259303 RepID=UPI003459EC83
MSQDNQTTKTSSKEKTATTKDTEKEAKVIHNVFIDTLEKPINTPLSRPAIDTSSSEKHPDSTVKNLAGLNRRRFMQGFGSISMTALSAASLGLAGCGSDSDERSYIVDETVRSASIMG